MIISGKEVCAISSCFREADLSALEKFSLLEKSDNPASGDIVLAKALDIKGAYQYVEYGLTQKHVFSNGDLALLVLGNRHSSTHVYGDIQPHPLHIYDKIDLVSAAGMACQAAYVPSWFGSTTSSFEIVGFPSRDGIKPYNLSSVFAQRQPANTLDTDSPVPCVFVGGTSAQVGKTTFLRNLTRAYKVLDPDLQIGVIKATGTGSSKYLDLYKEAGADHATDYVYKGHPSTYGLDQQTFTHVLQELIEETRKKSDIVLVEIGGDLYEANSPVAVDIAGKLKASFVLVANDAMGAAEATFFLKQHHVDDVHISSFRQNLYSLAARLKIPQERTIDMNVEEQMKKFAVQNMPSQNWRIPNLPKPLMEILP